jgi:hypothetical protein
MALAIKISKSSGGGIDDYLLQTKSLSITHQRSPIAAPMPGSDPLLIDLGQWKATIVVSGTARFTGTNESEGGIAIADRDDLETIADPTATNVWHDKTITLTDNTDSPAKAYTVKISSLKLDKAETTDFYNFTLSMVGHLG